MEENDLIGKLVNLEIRVQHLEEIENSNYDENSVIAAFLDVFNFKKFLEIILHGQKKYRITQSFIYIVILFSFLSFIFWQNGILRLEKSSATVTLFLILVAGVFEFLGANTSVFKRFLFAKENKTKSFIEKLPSMNFYEIEQIVKNKSFSPTCMNYFIKMLENKELYSPRVIYLIIDNQMLTTENLDLLFSKKVITNLHADVVIRVLYKCKDHLKTQHIDSIYESFKSNEDVLKVLFATQKYSDSLLEIHPDNIKLKEYYKKFQLEKTYLNWALKLFPDSHRIWNAFLIYTITSLFFVTLIYLVITISNYQLSNDLLKFIMSVIMVLFVSNLVPFMKYFFISYRKYYIKQIIKC